MSPVTFQTVTRSLEKMMPRYFTARHHALIQSRHVCRQRRRFDISIDIDDESGRHKGPLAGVIERVTGKIFQHFAFSSILAAFSRRSRYARLCRA